MSARNVQRLVTLLVCLCLASYFTQAGPPPASAHVESSESVARELQRCLSWAAVPQDDVETRRQITDVYVSLAQYSTATLRAGIAAYLNTYHSLSYQRVDATDKVFAL